METFFNTKLNIYLKGIFLLGFALLWIKLLITGNILNFIAPRMIPFISFSALAFFLLGTIQLFLRDSSDHAEHDCNCGSSHHQRTSFTKSILIYAIFLAPLLIGFLFPDQTLGSSGAANKGIQYGRAKETPKDIHQKVKPPKQTSSPKNATEDLLSKSSVVLTDDTFIPILDEMESHIDRYVGKEVQLTGFVYRDPKFNHNQLVVARYAISCCIADASVYGLMAESSKASHFKDDSWVKVKGILKKTVFDHSKIPMLQIQSVTALPKPKNPYLYEQLTRID
ncbi:TIGR03943 family putative permease subunit [Metabacillus sp. RGM 3146]|uniref:TIGR03943 family putative permease subunit n=1 Tax=Metabacillus sp. RGM 3146 TaxID=3401092 RepID=UPI003B997EB7